MEATTARIEETEERIGELEDKIMEKEEGEKKREKGAEGVLEEIIAENFPNLGRKKALKFKRHRELPSDVTLIDLLHDIS